MEPAFDDLVPGATGSGDDAPSVPAPAGPTDHLAVLAGAERTLDDVDHALARLDDGTYGSCEVCGEPIADARLAVMPTARSCGAHPQLTDAAG